MPQRVMVRAIPWAWSALWVACFACGTDDILFHTTTTSTTGAATTTAGSSGGAGAGGGGGAVTLPVIIHELAEGEMSEASAYYAQARVGLGDAPDRDVTVEIHLGAAARRGAMGGLVRGRRRSPGVISGFRQ